MLLLKKKLGEAWTKYAQSRAVICRNSLSGKTLAFPLEERPPGKYWEIVGLVDLSSRPENTWTERLKGYNEQVLGVEYSRGQVFGV